MAPKKNIIWLFQIILLIAVCGCSKEEPKEFVEIETWEPNSQQLSRSQEVAREFALQKLEVSDKHFDLMKVLNTGWYEDEKKTLYLQFFNPEAFPDWENMVAMAGGFPDYFTISVDVSNWVVIDHYASPF